ncbi:hypothetical protein AGI3411_03147 [Achromobacter agilis]|uniref:Lysozyme inhibitor LprI-like N-terminal domain-containing protein n=2 Tax=Achromobacter agilis TaxID=1353888 RepID=A0A446CHV3_9BURK|nr:hypothetical protein AGI3411_03147 [Achromobacter agilis]
MNCSQARSASEKAICADADLVRLDADLAAAYAALGRAKPDTRDALRQSQRDWLARRNACAADAACLRWQYELRLDALQGQLRRAQAYRPDGTDLQALEDFRRAVEAAASQDAAFPLETALKALSASGGTTSFSNVRDKEDDIEAHFPTARPTGVSEDEWRALLASDVDSGGENGVASYTLIDLDGDGLRDLAIDSYVGGTGLFSEISTLRRIGARFGAPSGQSAEANRADAPSGATLYSLNDRGANQAGEWIRLRGRVYAAYRSSRYGMDSVYLLHPLAEVGDAPTLTVRYRYDLSVPRQQKNETTGAVRALDEALHAALTRALAQIDPERVATPGEPAKPLCPMPANTKEDERSQYYSFGPGHYAYETVADVAVQLRSGCAIARLADWFGGYSAKDGLYAQLWVRGTADDARTDTYNVHGVRRAVRYGTAVGPVATGDDAQGAQ